MTALSELLKHHNLIPTGDVKKDLELLRTVMPKSYDESKGVYRGKKKPLDK